MDYASLLGFASMLISLGSLAASVFSVYFTVRLWSKTNRPLVTAKISTHSGGNANIMLDIVVENSGTRPALDIQLHACEEDIRDAMIDPKAEAPLPRDAERVFFSKTVIPVLANGRSLSNAFGATGQDGVWRPGARIPVKVTYKSLGGTRYEEPGELVLFDDAGFAQTCWSGPREQDISHHVVTLADQSRG